MENTCCTVYSYDNPTKLVFLSDFTVLLMFFNLFQGDESSQQKVTKMFIGGIKDDTTEDDIRNTFSGFGNLTKVELITDKGTGKAKGFCFVTFDDHDAVDKYVCKFISLKN